LRGLDGGASHSARTVGAENATKSIEIFDPPIDLLGHDLEVWKSLAPLAFAARTLTRSTALAFELMCRNIVIAKRLTLDVEKAGGSDHRGMVQRVDAEMLAFNLRPCGKAMYEPVVVEAAVNPLAKFRQVK